MNGSPEQRSSSGGGGRSQIIESLAARIHAGRATPEEVAELNRMVEEDLAKIAGGEADLLDGRPRCVCCGRKADLRCDDCGETAACTACVLSQDAGFHCVLCARFQCSRCLQGEVNINPRAAGDHYREHLTADLAREKRRDLLAAVLTVARRQERARRERGRQ